MLYRHRVLLWLCGLLTVLMLDRVCISVAGPRMQAALGIGPVGWGWVLGAFTLAYGLFEIPGGILADRVGPRRVLTRIVLWWSVFTALTGVVSGLPALMAVRFLFGAGEAGGYPNASVALGRWFPVAERGRAFGWMLMAGQLGGALAPLLVVPLQRNFGWRASFWTFGLLGPVWAAGWYWWFRDSPADKAGVSDTELAETADLPMNSHHDLPWSTALRSPHVWLTVAICFCYMYTYSFFSSWFHTYLVKARGFSEGDLWLSSLPYLVAGACNFAGGLLTSRLVVRLGLRWGRCLIGVVGLSLAAVSIVGVLLTHGHFSGILFLSLALGAITCQQPVMFAVCLDIGGRHGGVTVGVMNSAAGFGSFVSALAFGYLVKLSGSYAVPLIPMAALLLLGTWLWTQIDPRQEIDATHPER